MIPWEIYDIITHDSSSHFNLPLVILEQCGKSMHQQFNKLHKKKEKKTLHILTHGTMRGFRLILWWFASMAKHVIYIKREM